MTPRRGIGDPGVGGNAATGRRRLAAAVAAGVLALLAAAAAPGAEMSPAEEAALVRACQGAGEEEEEGEGAATRRLCRERELGELARVPRPGGLDPLPARERHRLDRACAGAAAYGPAEFRRCQAMELRRLAAAGPAPARPREDAGASADAAVPAARMQPRPDAETPPAAAPAAGAAPVPPGSPPGREAAGGPGIAVAPAAGLGPVAGAAAVVDGDTLEVGGVRVRLWGVAAPAAGQTCLAEGRSYPCGRDAAAALAGRIGGRPVSCAPRDRDPRPEPGGEVAAVCAADGEQLNAWVVEQGWALAFREHSAAYGVREAAAKRARRGLWRGGFELPWEWREEPAGAGKAAAGAGAGADAVRTLVVRVPAAVARAAPSAGAPRLGSLSRGDIVRELGREGGWLRVGLADGRAGWVRGDLLDDAAAPVP